MCAASAQGTDIVDKEMYSFTDKGGRDITLRPEFTAGIVRAYLRARHEDAGPSRSSSTPLGRSFATSACRRGAIASTRSSISSASASWTRRWTWK